MRGGGAQTHIDLPTQPGHRCGQLVAAPRRFAQPERDVRRLALGILDAHAAGLDLDDAVGGIAELEDIAGQALDGKIFVDRADFEALGFQQHRVVGIVGNGAAGGQRGQTTSASSAQAAVDQIAVQVGAACTVAGGVALGEHRQQRLIIRLAQIGVRHGPTDQCEQRILLPFPARHLGHDLLRQHVQRSRGDHQGIQLAAAHGIEQGGAFDQVVA